MAVMMVMRWPGVTSNQYEHVRKSSRYEEEVPQGLLFHAASFSDGAMHVTDIWESEADFGRFQEERLGAAVQQAGITTDPEAIVNQLHAVFNPGVAKA